MTIHLKNIITLVLYVFFCIGLCQTHSASNTITLFDKNKPQLKFSHEYSQKFNSTVDWDSVEFYNRWSTLSNTCFHFEDIKKGYLQLEKKRKRILITKTVFTPPYTFETEIEYGLGSNYGGIVLRAWPIYLDQLQESTIDPIAFNREGIAIFPSKNGDSIMVQFSGIFNANKTETSCVSIPKPERIRDFRNKGKFTIEDFGSSIILYYNDIQCFKIKLQKKKNNIYSSGTLYTPDLKVAGSFKDMEIESTGKIAVAQRNATIKLYNFKINYNQDLKQQSISIKNIDKKTVNDKLITISATASSSLPVKLRIVSGPAVLNGTTIKLTRDTGVVVLKAEQKGNSEYYSAHPVTKSFYVTDTTKLEILSKSQDYVDDWVATDALKRELPTYKESGSLRKNKFVGVFYYTWHGYHGDKVFDITKIISEQRENSLSPGNPNWPIAGTTCFWGEPEEGYFRSDDPWVIRRNLQMLSNAHVDFIFIDATNGPTYMEAVSELCRVSMQMRKDGIYTPQIAFTTFSRSGQIMNELYDVFYSQAQFADLWFYWNGKPLILGDFNDITLRPEVKDFFTIKYCWAWTDSKNQPNHWQWLDDYPQDYGWSTNPNIPEQIVVSTASHPTLSKGKSFQSNQQPVVNEKYVTDFTDRGLYFAEQWKRALEVDPQVLMITQWNEWTAGAFVWNEGDGIYAGRKIQNGNFYFVDVFTQEFNRDIAPMKGGHTDNYYYQMVSNIRKFKGMNTPLKYSLSNEIKIDGKFSDWSFVNPVYKDPKGDTMHRNSKGYDPNTVFINNTGRNDIIESKVSYDDSKIFFYVKTAQELTPFSDPNWMLLFIDADKNKETGWEGYDYVVNLGVESTFQTTLKQWDGIKWSNEQIVPYAISNSAMEIEIPRSLLNSKKTGLPEFYFHWFDNPRQLNDISAFFTDGDSAPDRRFNYNFSPN